MKVWGSRGSPIPYALLGLDDLMNTISHEIGHGLGYTIDHGGTEPAIKVIENALKKTPNGYHCSVMPYGDITTFSNICLLCDNGEPLFPGPLDRAVIKYKYTGKLSAAKPPYQDLLIYNAISLSAHNFLSTFLQYIENPNTKKPLLPTKLAYLVVDGGFLASAIYMQAPMSANMTFILGSSVKYFRTSSENYPNIKFSLSVLNKSLITFNLIAALTVNAVTENPVDTMTNLACTIGTSIGSSFGGYILGRVAATSINMLTSGIRIIFESKNSVIRQGDISEETDPLLSETPSNIPVKTRWFNFWHSCVGYGNKHVSEVVRQERKISAIA